MRHLSNIFNHRSPEARMLFHGYTYHEWCEGPQAIERAWLRHLDWINKNIISPPQATPYYSVKELKDMGMIGSYARD